MANSIIADVVWTYNAMLELKKYELSQLNGKIDGSYKKLEKHNLRLERFENSDINKLSKQDRRTYKRLRFAVWQRLQRINRLKQKRDVLERNIQSGKVSICFGTKKLFKAQWFLEENGFASHEEWLKTFRQNRDKNILFLGSKDETACNLMFQLEEMNGVYQIKVRKVENRRINPSGEKYVYGMCKFRRKDFESYLSANLENRKSKDACMPLTYRIVFRGKRIYLQVLFEYKREDFSHTTNVFGTIGIDYNDGFMQVAETNETGNLVRLERIPLDYHGTGNRAKSEIEEKIAKIVHRAIVVGKTIVIEDLDFRKTKSKTQTGKTERGKQYNRMLHKFDYSRYKETLENCCYRNNVELIKVNPAYTSRIAKAKYCESRKLNVHAGAAFVIARRGMGLKDVG
jgi:transposase, IS605 orfB family